MLALNVFGSGLAGSVRGGCGEEVAKSAVIAGQLRHRFVALDERDRCSILFPMRSTGGR